MADVETEQWVRAIFDHPVTDPPWHYPDDADIPDEDGTVNLRMLREVYEHAPALLASYTETQIAQGLWLIASSSCSDVSASLGDERLPMADRLATIDAMGSLFERFFAVRCSDHLSHLDEPGARALNAVCYMWWDILPRWPRAVPTESDLRCLAVMERVLALDCEACCESALHGLGHWALVVPAHTQPIVDRFLGYGVGRRPELLAYARAAREGAVQ